MSENKEIRDNSPENKEQFSLNDDRRVKVLSPGALVVKRFFRNRLAVIGMIMLITMFVFSFVGGFVSPYGEDEQFYRYEEQMKEYVGVVRNNDFRYTAADGEKFDSVLQAKFQLTVNKQEKSFEYKDTVYEVTAEGTDFYSISSNGKMIAIAFKDIVNSENSEISFVLKYDALKAYTNGETSFTSEGREYTLDEDGNLSEGGAVVAYISRFIVSPVSADVLLFICKTLLFYYMVYFISIFKFLQDVFACFLIIRKISAFAQ